MTITVDVAGDGNRALEIRQVLIAGYTGRDQAKVLAHIRELAELGVAPPPRVPMVYTLDPAMLTTGDLITVSCAETSGEAEFVLIGSSDGLLVGVGSDHTDRQQEAVDVQSSKERVPHPIGRQVWRYDEVKSHWDAIELRSWTKGQLYQEGRLEAFLQVDELLAKLRQAGYGELNGRVIFGGTLPTIGGLTYGRRFEAELHDRNLKRTVRCAYDVTVSGA